MCRLCSHSSTILITCQYLRDILCQIVVMSCVVIRFSHACENCLCILCANFTFLFALQLPEDFLFFLCSSRKGIIVKMSLNHLITHNDTMCVSFFSLPQSNIHKLTLMDAFGSLFCPRIHPYAGWISNDFPIGR